jgi:hypothetical protein
MISPLLVRSFVAALSLLSCSAVLRAQSTNQAAGAAPAGASNLVTNGDFELATADPSWPDDWAKGAGITWETEGGKHFLRLTQITPGKMLMAYREVPIPAGVKKLTITIRYRSAGVVAGAQNYMDARGIFHFLDSNRKNLPGDPKTMDMTNNATDWTTASEDCVVPDGAEKLVVMPSLFQVSSGTLDLAEVSVTPAS